MADLKEKSDSMLSTTTVSFQTAASTTLYTIPTGKRCVLTRAIVICGSAASTTVKFTIGKSTSTADFLAENTGTNLAAQYDALNCVPIPNVTPLKSKSYAADEIIQFTVTTADVDGSTDAKVILYGTLY